MDWLGRMRQYAILAIENTQHLSDWCCPEPRSLRIQKRRLRHWRRNTFAAFSSPERDQTPVPDRLLDGFDLPVIKFHRHTASEDVDDHRYTAVGLVNDVDFAFLILKVAFFDTNPIA